jgi:hypothetical protein
MKKAKNSIIFKDSKKLIKRFKINESLAHYTFINKFYLTKWNLMDTDRFWNKTNFEVVPLDQKFAISFFFLFFAW